MTNVLMDDFNPSSHVQIEYDGRLWYVRWTGRYAALSGTRADDNLENKSVLSDLETR